MIFILNHRQTERHQLYIDANQRTQKQDVFVRYYAPGSNRVQKELFYRKGQSRGRKVSAHVKTEVPLLRFKMYSEI